MLTLQSSIKLIDAFTSDCCSCIIEKLIMRAPLSKPKLNEKGENKQAILTIASECEVTRYGEVYIPCISTTNGTNLSLSTDAKSMISDK